MLPAWFYFALGSAVFAGLTALFGKIGVANISSNLATFLRTSLFYFFGGIVMMTGEWQPTDSRDLALCLVSHCHRGILALLFKVLQLGPASRVVPVDKLVLSLLSCLPLFF